MVPPPLIGHPRARYVTVHSGALQSEMLPIQPGDAVECNMTRTGEYDWFIGSKIKSTGKETNQNVVDSTPGARLRTAKQPWASVPRGGQSYP
jgi:hypothetical protein